MFLGSFAVFWSSFAVLCGPLRSFAVFSITLQKQQIWLRTALCGARMMSTYGAIRNHELHARNDDDDVVVADMVYRLRNTDDITKALYCCHALLTTLSCSVYFSSMQLVPT